MPNNSYKYFKRLGINKTSKRYRITLLHNDTLGGIILKEDMRVDPTRVVDISKLRCLKTHAEALQQLVDDLNKHRHANRYTRELLDAVLEFGF